MSGKKIVFTGGSGKGGRVVIPYLISKGHRVLNLDLVPFPDPSVKVETLKTDLTDSGQVFNALTDHFSMDDYGGSSLPGPPDVVIHFAAYARTMIVPDSELFRTNTQSTYNVIEAASKLGVKKIIIASSETVYGVCFAQGERPHDYYPLEEDYDVNPEDTYALSKVIGEKTARAFCQKYKSDIYCLRIGNIMAQEDYAAMFPKFLADPPSRRRNAWTYIDARDLGQICDLCIQKDGLGFQVFNATNDTITVRDEDLGEEGTAGFLKKVCPGIEIRREMGKREGPMSNRKIREVLGFKDVHDWKKYV